MLIRHGEPNQYDQQPYGTACKVINGSDEFEIYVQLSNDEESPRWHLVGSFTTKSSEEHIQHAIEQILK